ncbi:MAG: NusA N-terminal domain-containing protein, partial [Candidatus Margulisiibacteriota bacterium]
MIKIDGLKEVVAQIKSERGIPEEEILSAISDALVLAAKRYHGPADNLRAVLNDQTGEATIIATKLVVKEVVEPSAEISLKDAKKLNPKAKVDEEVEIEVIPPDFGRIAAQKAKQVITQRIVEAEKKSIMSEFEDKIGHLVTGIVQRIEGRNYLINLGRTEAVL